MASNQRQQAPAASTELVAMKEKALTIRDYLVARKGELAAALPKQLDADRFLRICFNSMQKNPDLYGCTKESIYSAVMRSASLGLEPDDGRGLAYLIPRKDHGVLKANFQIGYKGIIDLARRSEKGMTFETSVVYNKEPFRLVLGGNSLLEHSPLPVSQRAEPGSKFLGITGAYAVAWIPGATRGQWRWLWIEEIEDRRARSQVPNGPAWKNDYAAMCCKTACIALGRLLPQNPELAAAIEEDDADDTGRDGGLVIDVDFEPPAPADPEKKPEEPALPTKDATTEKEKPKAEPPAEPEDDLTAMEPRSDAGKPAGNGEDDLPVAPDVLKKVYEQAKALNTKANKNTAAVELIEFETGKRNASKLTRGEARKVLESMARALAGADQPA